MITIKFYDQTKFGGCDAPIGERGNCDKSCLATLIGCDPSEIPDYQDLVGDAWWKERDRFLHSMGFHIITFGDLIGSVGGLCIAAGKSPRGKYNHAVLARVTSEHVEFIHDPHPSRAFLDGAPTTFDFVFRVIEYRDVQARELAA